MMRSYEGLNRLVSTDNVIRTKINIQAVLFTCNQETFYNNVSMHSFFLPMVFSSHGFTGVQNRAVTISDFRSQTKSR